MNKMYTKTIAKDILERKTYGEKDVYKEIKPEEKFQRVFFRTHETV